MRHATRLARTATLLALLGGLVPLGAYAADGSGRMAARDRTGAGAPIVAPAPVPPAPSVEALEAEIRAELAAGRKYEAASLQARLVELLREEAPDAADLAAGLHRLGVLRQHIGPYAGAEANFREALELREGLTDTSHPKLDSLVRSLETIIARLRPDDPEREALLLRLLDIDENSSTHRRLGEYYVGLERHTAALEHHTRSVELEQARDNPSRERLASYLEGLAGAYRAVGDAEQAEGLLLDALEAREGVLGQRHPRLTRTLKQLGELYHDENRMVEAEQVLERALELETAAWGHGSHPCGCGVAGLLDAVREALGRPVEIALRDDLPTEASAAEPDDPRVEQIRALNDQIAGARATGDFDVAVEQAHAALTLRREVFGESAPESIDGLIVVGRQLRSQGRYAEAVEVLTEAIAGLEAAPEPNASRLVGALHLAGTSLRTLRRDAEAEGYFEQELELRRARGENRRAATLLEMLASIRRGAERHGPAREAYDAATELWGVMAGPASPETFRLEAGQAAMLIKEERYDEAEAVLLELLELAEAEGREPVVLFQVLQPLEQLYRRTDRADDAAAMHERLDELRATLQ